MHVLTVPQSRSMSAPKPGDVPNLPTVLHLVAELRCNMYENALVPVSFANKLVLCPTSRASGS